MREEERFLKAFNW